jgi:fucose permease
MGLVADSAHSMQIAFVVPLVALIYITFTALVSRNRRPANKAATA